MKYVWWLEGTEGQLLDDVTEAERKRALAELDISRWADERDDAIRQLIERRVPVKAIVTASGLSRERIYQIRDRRR